MDKAICQRRSSSTVCLRDGETGTCDYEADKRYGYVLVFEQVDDGWWLHGGSRYSPEVEVYPGPEDLA